MRLFLLVKEPAIYCYPAPGSINVCIVPIIEEALAIGAFFVPYMHLPAREWWEYVVGSIHDFIPGNSSTSLISGMEKLADLIDESQLTFFSPVPHYKAELEALQWWQLGDAYRYHDEQRAIWWYEKAVTRLVNEGTLKETLAAAYYQVASTRYEEKSYADMIQLLSRALEILPTYARAYYERGVAYSWLRRFDQALEDLNRALELDPQDDFSYCDRGIILLGLRKKEQAYIDFNYAYQLNPIDIEPLWVHCWAHMSKDGKDEKTMKQIEELTKESSLLKYVTDRDIEYVCGNLREE